MEQVMLAVIGSLLVLQLIVLLKLRKVTTQLNDVQREMSFFDDKLDNHTKRIVKKLNSTLADTLNYMETKDILPNYSAVSDEDLYQEAIELAHEEEIVTPALFEKHFRIDSDKAVFLINKMEEAGVLALADSGRMWVVVEEDDNDKDEEVESFMV